MNHSDDLEIDALLREQFDGPVPDDGFADRVMQHPRPHRRRAAWPVAAGILGGIGTCWLSLSATPLLQVGWHAWINGERSACAIVVPAAMAGMALLACWWSTMEPEGP